MSSLSDYYKFPNLPSLKDSGNVYFSKMKSLIQMSLTGGKELFESKLIKNVSSGRLTVWCSIFGRVSAIQASGSDPWVTQYEEGKVLTYKFFNT